MSHSITLKKDCSYLLLSFIATNYEDDDKATLYGTVTRAFDDYEPIDKVQVIDAMISELELLKDEITELLK